MSNLKLCSELGASKSRFTEYWSYNCKYNLVAWLFRGRTWAALQVAFNVGGAPRPGGNQHNNYIANLFPITPGQPFKTERVPIILTWNIALFDTNRRTTQAQRKWFLSRNERYYVFTTLLSSVSRFVIILWIFRGFGRPWGWNPSKHKRGNADGEFQNNMILSRRLGGPNKIYLNINAHRGVHYLEVLSKHGRCIPTLSFITFNNRHRRGGGAKWSLGNYYTVYCCLIVIYSVSW